MRGKRESTKSKRALSLVVDASSVKFVVDAEQEGLLEIETDPKLNGQGEVVKGIPRAYTNHDVLCGHPGRGRQPVKAIILTKKGAEEVVDSAGKG